MIFCYHLMSRRLPRYTLFKMKTRCDPASNGLEVPVGVSVEIPREPSSTALLGLGGVMLLRRRSCAYITGTHSV